MEPTRSIVPAPRTDAERVLLTREHDALERLYIVRSQIDYVRAQQLTAAAPESGDGAALPRLEHAYATAVRDYETVHAARLFSAAQQTPLVAWDGAASGVLLTLAMAMLWFIVRQRRRFAARPSPPRHR